MVKQHKLTAQPPEAKTIISNSLEHLTLDYAQESRAAQERQGCSVMKCGRTLAEYTVYKVTSMMSSFRAGLSAPLPFPVAAV